MAEMFLDKNGQPTFVMSHLFTAISSLKYAHTIELGRAFVQPKYQSTKWALKFVRFR